MENPKKESEDTNEAKNEEASEETNVLEETKVPEETNVPEVNFNATKPKEDENVNNTGKK